MKLELPKIKLTCLALTFIVSLAPLLVRAQTKPFQIMVMDAGFNDVELKGTSNNDGFFVGSIAGVAHR
jgi:hypothetical protein